LDALYDEMSEEISKSNIPHLESSDKQSSDKPTRRQVREEAIGCLRREMFEHYVVSHGAPSLPTDGRCSECHERLITIFCPDCRSDKSFLCQTCDDDQHKHSPLALHGRRAVEVETSPSSGEAGASEPIGEAVGLAR
jgi:hypothetical protein